MNIADLIRRARRAISDLSLRHLSGSVSVGPLTLYGDNAMAFQADLRVEALGVTLSLRPGIRRPWQFYVSPNGTPWAAVLACGPGVEFFDAKRVRDRLEALRCAPTVEDEVSALTRQWCAPQSPHA